MGITVIPDVLFRAPMAYGAIPFERKLSEIAQEGKFYRHPDSAYISYPVVVQKPLGTIKKEISIAIIGAGASGMAAIYELSKLPDSKKNIHVTVYESDPEHFINQPPGRAVSVKGLKAGRVSAAVSSANPKDLQTGNHAVYEIGAMRFPEIAGLMWHYAAALYGGDKTVGLFPNPGIVATELLHGERVDRFGNGKWLDDKSPTKCVVDVIRKGLVGGTDPVNTSLYPIGGKDPAKVSELLKDENTSVEKLKQIDKDWKAFALENDKLTLSCAVRVIITAKVEELPDIAGLDGEKKINYYIDLFGTVGFGTGGFKSVYNMSLLEITRLLLWNYSYEYILPVDKNVTFIKNLYQKACETLIDVKVRGARVTDVANFDDASGKTSGLVVSYDIDKDGNEVPTPRLDTYDYVILATTPGQVTHMITKAGFVNTPRPLDNLGKHKHPVNPNSLQGSIRPPLILSKDSATANSQMFSAVSNLHMTSCSKIFATVKKTDFDAFAPQFLDVGKVKAIVADCGLGSCYVVPSTLPDDNPIYSPEDYYSFLISYAWEDDSKRMQHDFVKYPLNINDTNVIMDAVIHRTLRYVKDPITGTYGKWWFGEAMSKCKLEDPLSYDWTTFDSSGAFKLDNAGDSYNSNLTFRYHTHALNPDLKNKFFLASCSYGHLGGWLEGAFMSAVNAVCGLIVAANDGDKTALTPEAQKVVDTLDPVAEKK